MAPNVAAQAYAKEEIEIAESDNLYTIAQAAGNKETQVAMKQLPTRPLKTICHTEPTEIF